MLFLQSAFAACFAAFGMKFSTRTILIRPFEMPREESPEAKFLLLMRRADTRLKVRIQSHIGG